MIHGLNLAKYVERSYEERPSSNGEFIQYGADNLFPQYLIDLYNSSPTHHALVNSIATMIYGDGVQGNTLGVAWAKSGGLDDELRKTCVDLKLQGGFYWLIQWNLEHTQIKSISHTPFEQWRQGEMDRDGNVNEYIHSVDWEDQRAERESYPSFDANKNEPVQILCVKPFSVGSMYYPKPDYIGSINWVEVDKQIAIFHNNNLQNGMSPGFAIHWKNGIPPKDAREEIRRDVERQLSGVRNAGNFWMTFSDGGDTAPDITPFELSQASEQFQFLSGESTDKIMIGHRVTSPALFGVKTEGQLGGSQELASASEIFNANVIEPYQRAINDALGMVMKYTNIGGSIFIAKEVEQGADATQSYTGIQISSAVDIISKVKTGEITSSQATQLLVSLLNFEPEVAQAMFKEDTQFSSHKCSHDLECSHDDDKDWTPVFDYLETVGEQVDLSEWDLISESEVEEPEMEYGIHLKGQDVKFFKRFADPDEKSEIDSGLYKVRYRYSQNLKDNSRLFCKNMVANSKGGVVYRFEDIQEMESAKINGEFAPQGKDKYNIWLYKGGAYCHHRWVRQVYFRKRSKGKFLPNKGLDNDKRVSVASATGAGVPMKDTSKGWNTAKTAPINTPSKGKLN